MLALVHPLSSLLRPCSGPGPAASSGLFLRPLPTSPLSVIPVNPLNVSRDTHATMLQFQGEIFLSPTDYLTHLLHGVHTDTDTKSLTAFR